MSSKMTSIAVSQFRANLLEYLKKVERGEKIIITSHGDQVAMLVPPQNEAALAQEKLQELRQSACLGDLLTPVSNDWKNLS